MTLRHRTTNTPTNKSITNPHHQEETTVVDNDNTTSDEAKFSSIISNDQPPSSSIMEEDFILNGYNINADPNPNPILKFLATHFPNLVEELLSAFGIAPVITLVMVYFFVKGIAVTAFNMASLPLFRDGLNVTDGATYQQIITITGMAWPMKPIIGLLSDAFPIWAFRKKYYLLGAAISCVSILIGICLLPRENLSPYPVAAMMFCTNLCFATIDLLCEAVYSRFYVLRPKAGTSIVSLVWGLVMISGVPGAFFVGPLADAHRPFVALLVVALLVACCIYPFYRNWLGEKPVSLMKLQQNKNKKGMIKLSQNDDEEMEDSSSNNRNSSNVEHENKDNNVIVDQDENNDSELKESTNATTEEASASPPSRNNNNVVEDDIVTTTTTTTPDNDNEQTPKFEDSVQPQISSFEADNIRRQSIAMGIICPLTAGSALFIEFIHRNEDTSNTDTKNHASLALKKLIIPLCSACLLIFLAKKWLPRKIFKPMTFMFLQEAMYLSLAGALDFFYLADEKCAGPGAPHFSYFYYQTVTSAVGSFFGGVGSYLFHKYFSKMNFQKIFYTTVTMRIIASLFDVVLVNRWNVNYLGIADEHFYLFGDAIIYPTTYVLNFMPAVMLTAQLCPEGHEATMYSLLAGLSNSGQTLAGFLGSFLTILLGIRTKPLAGGTNSNNHLMNYTSNISDDIGNNITQASSIIAGPTCNFENLGLLIIIAHAIIPAFTLPLISILVPRTTAASPSGVEKKEQLSTVEVE